MDKERPFSEILGIPGARFKVSIEVRVAIRTKSTFSRLIPFDIEEWIDEKTDNGGSEYPIGQGSVSCGSSTCDLVMHLPWANSWHELESSWGNMTRLLGSFLPSSAELTERISRGMHRKTESRCWLEWRDKDPFSGQNVGLNTSNQRYVLSNKAGREKLGLPYPMASLSRRGICWLWYFTADELPETLSSYWGVHNSGIDLMVTQFWRERSREVLEFAELHGLANFEKVSGPEEYVEKYTQGPKLLTLDKKGNMVINERDEPLTEEDILTCWPAALSVWHPVTFQPAHHGDSTKLLFRGHRSEYPEKGLRRTLEIVSIFSNIK